MNSNEGVNSQAEPTFSNNDHNSRGNTRNSGCYGCLAGVGFMGFIIAAVLAFVVFQIITLFVGIQGFPSIWPPPDVKNEALIDVFTGPVVDIADIYTLKDFRPVIVDIYAYTPPGFADLHGSDTYKASQYFRCEVDYVMSVDSIYSEVVFDTLRIFLMDSIRIESDIRPAEYVLIENDGYSNEDISNINIQVQNDLRNIYILWASKSYYMEQAEDAAVTMIMNIFSDLLASIAKSEDGYGYIVDVVIVEN